MFKILRSVGILAILMVLTAIADPVAASPREGPNRAEKAGAAPASTALGRLALAQAVLHSALLGGDPVLGIAAARLAVSASTEETADEVERILATARDLAGPEPALQAMLDALGSDATRGRAATTQQRTDGDAPAGQTVSVGEDDVIVFKAGEPAEVYLVGQGEGDLDLIVRDELGNEICRSEGASDREYCSWVPIWQGPFRIEVINRGVRDNAFSLITN